MTSRLPGLHDILSSLSLLSLLLLHISSTHADLPSFAAQEVEEYNKGTWGVLPVETFHSTNITAYRPLRTSYHSSSSSSSAASTNNSQHLFLAPRGTGITSHGPTILDEEGHLVWHGGAGHDHVFSKAFDLHPQMYRGEAYLTWWAGWAMAGHGEGVHYMYDKHYQLYKTIGAIGGTYKGDDHEFKITQDDTALLTIYDVTLRDMTSVGGPVDGAFWECFFQEIDIETDTLLFEWRASDHITFDDVYVSYNLLNTSGSKLAWDWFHINSVDKDDQGNYLVSARYLNALLYIDGQTGEIIWQLGGKNNAFTDLSDGRIINMYGQHDARWRDNYTAITLFDNHANNANHISPSRGLKIRVDQHAMTVDLIAEALHPNGYIVTSQGSCQQLDNGNLFLGYGIKGHMAEFSPDGSELLRDWQFGMVDPPKTTEMGSMRIENYRAFKEEWHGYPLQPPDVAIEGGRFYVSWNGATEHREWVLEGMEEAIADVGGVKRAAWVAVGSFQRDGFESEVELSREYETYRLTALDADSNELGVWVVRASEFPLVTPIPCSPPTTPTFSDWLLFAGAAILLSFASSTLYRYYKHHHGGGGMVKLHPSLPQSQLNPTTSKYTDDKKDDNNNNNNNNAKERDRASSSWQLRWWWWRPSRNLATLLLDVGDEEEEEGDDDDDEDKMCLLKKREGEGEGEGAGAGAEKTDLDLFDEDVEKRRTTKRRKRRWWRRKSSSGLAW